MNIPKLLSLCKPKTTIPDEKVFIVSHQLTELHFNLIIHELKQIVHDEQMGDSIFLSKLKRCVIQFDSISAYFANIPQIIEKNQFLSFRDILEPSSGFQSFQFRVIELLSTELINLSRQHQEQNLQSGDFLHNIYWKSGAAGSDGVPTRTLTMFESKWSGELNLLAKENSSKNLNAIYTKRYQSSSLFPELTNWMKAFDFVVNHTWRFIHLKIAAHYLGQDPHQEGTGGTNWRTYLSPSRQPIIFFPQLWTTEELSNWRDVNFSL